MTLALHGKPLLDNCPVEFEVDNVFKIGNISLYGAFTSVLILELFIKAWKFVVRYFWKTIRRLHESHEQKIIKEKLDQNPQ